MRYYPLKRRARPHCRVDSTRPVGHSVHMPGRELERLAEALIGARARLGMTQEEFADHAQVSITTVRRIEQKHGAPRTTTFGKLDKGAGWVDGSARAVYIRGDPPVLINDLRDDNERKLWALDLPVDVRRGYIDRYRADQRAAQTGQ